MSVAHFTSAILHIAPVLHSVYECARLTCPLVRLGSTLCGRLLLLLNFFLLFDGDWGFILFFLGYIYNLSISSLCFCRFRLIGALRRLIFG